MAILCNVAKFHQVFLAAVNCIASQVFQITYLTKVLCSAEGSLGWACWNKDERTVFISETLSQALGL